MHFALETAKLFHEEINSRLKIVNTLYHSVQNLLSFTLLSEKIKIYRALVLPFVLYGCETWSLTLMEERKLRVFENEVLTIIFWPKSDDVTEEWRRLRTEELCELYSSPKRIQLIKQRIMILGGGGM